MLGDGHHSSGRDFFVLTPSSDNPTLALTELVTFLRAHCSWDKVQTLDTLKPNLIEETYEVLDALDALSASPSPANVADHREELGDLLLQILFQSELHREQGHFGFAEVCQSLHSKLVRRHPHLFDETLRQGEQGKSPYWETIKAQEREAKNKTHTSVLDGVPSALPALAKAQRITEKAAKVGFDWPDPSGAMLKVDEETQEIKEAILEGDQGAIEHEIGDLFLATVDLARHHNLEAESCLRKAIERFKSRFHHMEQSLRDEEQGFSDSNLEDLERRWQNAKKAL